MKLIEDFKKKKKDFYDSLEHGKINPKTFFGTIIYTITDTFDWKGDNKVYGLCYLSLASIIPLLAISLFINPVPKDNIIFKGLSCLSNEGGSVEAMVGAAVNNAAEMIKEAFSTDDFKKDVITILSNPILTLKSIYKIVFVILFIWPLYSLISLVHNIFSNKWKQNPANEGYDVGERIRWGSLLPLIFPFVLLFLPVPYIALSQSEIPLFLIILIWLLWNCLMLWFIYRFLPNNRNKDKGYKTSTYCIALFFGFLFTAFQVMVILGGAKIYSNPSKIYESLFLIVIFLIWLKWSWRIIILGNASLFTLCCGPEISKQKQKQNKVGTVKSFLSKVKKNLRADKQLR